MNCLSISFLLLILTTSQLPTLVNDPVQAYLSERGNFPNEKLLEINATLGPDNTDVIMLSTISSPGQYIWSVYAKKDQGYELLTGNQDSTGSIDFTPDSAVTDENTQSIIYLVNGGAHHGALLSIQVNNGKLSIATLALMGPGTEDPNWTNYQKYFGEGAHRLAVKTIPFAELQKSYNLNTKQTPHSSIIHPDIMNESVSSPQYPTNPTPAQLIQKSSTLMEPVKNDSIWTYVITLFVILFLIGALIFIKNK